MKHLPLITFVWIVSMGLILTGGFFLGRSIQGKEDLAIIKEINNTCSRNSVRDVTGENSEIWNGKYPTGYELWDEVNRYRVSQGKEELILDQKFCNNIASRAINYKNTNSHDGLREFAMNYLYPNGVRWVVEILNWGRTTKEIIGGWKTSPSHNLSLIDSKNVRGCAYSDDGYSVVLMGY